MARSPKLKVFSAPMGFYDALVAAPSQRAALKAWGTTTDLFAAGRASAVEDPELQALALAHPGEVVKHSRGAEADIIKEVARQEHRPAKRAVKESSRPSFQKRRAPPDRSKLDKAERDLDEARRELTERLSDIEERRVALDAEERKMRLEGESRIFELERERDRVRTAFERAGGRL